MASITIQQTSFINGMLAKANPAQNSGKGLMRVKLVVNIYGSTGATTPQQENIIYVVDDPIKEMEFDNVSSGKLEQKDTVDVILDVVPDAASPKIEVIGFVVGFYNGTSHVDGIYYKSGTTEFTNPGTVEISGLTIDLSASASEGGSSSDWPALPVE